jgi:hypothetical protein
MLDAYELAFLVQSSDRISKAFTELLHGIFGEGYQRGLRPPQNSAIDVAGRRKDGGFVG